MKHYNKETIKGLLLDAGIAERRAEAGALCALGKSAKEISRSMRIKEFSAKAYVSQVLEYLNIENRNKFILYCASAISDQSRPE